MRKLYFSNGSPFARRVRIVLEEKALEYDQDIFDALRPIDQIKEITPTLQVPVLKMRADPLGSDLIIAYLFENYPESNSRDMEQPLASSVFHPPFVGRISYCWKRLVLWLVDRQFTSHA